VTPARIAELRAVAARWLSPEIRDSDALPEALDEIERLEALRLSQVVGLREKDALIAQLQHENGQLRQGIQGAEIDRLRARIANLEADLDAMRAELLEAKRERNAALDRSNGR
jgi:outer membrane murein-binding lipoprotein Lpp